MQDRDPKIAKAVKSGEPYVYLYRRDGEPIYVGEGRRNRIYRHTTVGNGRYGNPRLRGVIQEDRENGTGRITREIVDMNLTDRGAVILERQTIARLRAEGYDLFNVLPEGNVATAEIRAKISRANTGRPNVFKGKSLPLEHRANISAAKKGMPNGLEGRKVPKKTAAKIAASVTESWNERERVTSEATKGKISVKLKDVPKASEHAAKLIALCMERNRTTLQTPEIKAKRGRAIAAAFARKRAARQAAELRGE